MPRRFGTVAITGAGSGIGRALSLQAAPRCDRLILVGRRRQALEETARLTGRAEGVLVVVADITTAPGRAAIRQAAGARLDVLINNAGIVHCALLERQDDATLDAMLQTNIAAPLSLTRDLLPALRAARGRVVFVGSVFGDIGHPFFAAYSASKHALRGLADTLRRELKGDRISVTYAAPRATRTDATQAYAALIGALGMRVDDPVSVARGIWSATHRRARSHYPWGMERVFVAIQRVLPGLIDAGLGDLPRKVADAAAHRPPL